MRKQSGAGLVPGSSGRAAALAIAYLGAVLAVMGQRLGTIANSQFAHWGWLPLALSFLLGLVFGAVLVREYSRIEVELGWVPVGFLLIAALAMAVWATAVWATAVWAAAGWAGAVWGVRAIYPLTVFLAGATGTAGAFIIFPLNACWRRESWIKRLACAAVGVPLGLGVALRFGRWTLAGTGLSTILFVICLLAADREFLIRGGLFLGSRVISGVRVVGREHVPESGGALLVSNHVTFLDGFLISSCLPRLVRYMIFKPYFELPVVHWVCARIGAIPTSETGPREVVASLRRARTALLQGDLVCIFAEGGITRTGALLPFKRGMDRIVAGTRIPIVPVHLDGLSGRTSSFVDGKLIWRWPQRAHIPVTISFGRALPPGATAEDARAAVERLAEEARENRAGLVKPPAVAV